MCKNRMGVGGPLCLERLLVTRSQIPSDKHASVSWVTLVQRQRTILYAPPTLSLARKTFEHRYTTIYTCKARAKAHRMLPLACILPHLHLEFLWISALSSQHPSTIFRMNIS